LTKFHCTGRTEGITPAEKLRLKSWAFVLTDANTPVIGEFVTKAYAACVSEGVKEISNDNPTIVPWAAQECMRSGVNYPNQYGPWMDAIFESELPDFDRSAFTEWLDQAETVAQLLSPKSFTPPVPLDQVVREPTVIDGTLYGSELATPRRRLPKDGSPSAGAPPFEKRRKTRRPNKGQPSGAGAGAGPGHPPRRRSQQSPTPQALPKPANSDKRPVDAAVPNAKPPVKGG
jgi:hypothetical protein